MQVQEFSPSQSIRRVNVCLRSHCGCYYSCVCFYSRSPFLFSSRQATMARSLREKGKRIPIYIICSFLVRLSFSYRSTTCCGGVCAPRLHPLSLTSYARQYSGYVKVRHDFIESQKKPTLIPWLLFAYHQKTSSPLSSSIILSAASLFSSTVRRYRQPRDMSNLLESI